MAWFSSVCAQTELKLHVVSGSLCAQLQLTLAANMKMRMRVRSVGVAPCKKVKTIIWQVGKNIHDTLSQMNAYVFMALPGFAEGSGESVVQGVRGSLGPGDSGWLQNLQEEVMSCPDPSRVVASRFPEG